MNQYPQHPSLGKVKTFNMCLPVTLHYLIHFFKFLKIFLKFIYDSHRERKRGRDIGRGRSRLHAPGARCGIRSRVSRIAPWAKGRRQTAVPPRDPNTVFESSSNLDSDCYCDNIICLYFILCH